jgi:hypothetical protein
MQQVWADLPSQRDKVTPKFFKRQPLAMRVVRLPADVWNVLSVQEFRKRSRGGCGDVDVESCCCDRGQGGEHRPLAAEESRVFTKYQEPSHGAKLAAIYA